MTRPEDCQTMTELRSVIDGIDADLVRLLARRQGCIDRAVVLKQGAGLPARIPDRVDEVLARVQATARREGCDEALATAVWRQLIEWSIAREETAMAVDSSGGS